SRARPGPSHAVRAVRAGRHPRAMTLVLLLAAVIVVADQVSKTAALAHLVPGHPVVLADGWLSLTLVMNPGLAFGLLGTLEPAFNVADSAISVGVALLAFRLLTERQATSA